MSHTRDRVTRTAIVNGRRAAGRGADANAVEAFKLALERGNPEQRGVAAEALEALQLRAIERDQVRPVIEHLVATTPAPVARFLRIAMRDDALATSIAERLYGQLDIDDRWRNRGWRLR